jgi:hypothetical protein
MTQEQQIVQAAKKRKGKANNPTGGKTHGMSQTKVYYCWHQIMRRCYNKTHPKYDDYGGRGIHVCEEFRDIIGFFNYVRTLPGFDAWNIKGSALSLDRINNDSHYERNNLRFADKTTQSTNQRPKKNKNSYTGIVKNGRTWRSQIKIRYKNIYIGVYPTAKMAALAYDKYVIVNGLNRPTNGLFLAEEPLNQKK